MYPRNNNTRGDCFLLFTFCFWPESFFIPACVQTSLGGSIIPGTIFVTSKYMLHVSSVVCACVCRRLRHRFRDLPSAHARYRPTRRVHIAMMQKKRTRRMGGCVLFSSQGCMCVFYKNGLVCSTRYTIVYSIGITRGTSWFFVPGRLEPADVAFCSCLLSLVSTSPQSAFFQGNLLLHSLFSICFSGNTMFVK